MSEYGHIGDYDVFVSGKWLTTFYSITLSKALELVSYFPYGADEIDVVLKV